jgi:hypothetical protein
MLQIGCSYEISHFIDAIYSTKEGLHNQPIAQKYSVEQPVQFGKGLVSKI